MRTGFDQTVGMCSVTIAFRWFIRSYLISSHLISSHPIPTQPISHHISSHLISSRLILSQLVSSHLISSQLIPSHIFSNSLIIHVFKTNQTWINSSRAWLLIPRENLMQTRRVLNIVSKPQVVFIWFLIGYQDSRIKTKEIKHINRIKKINILANLHFL